MTSSQHLVPAPDYLSGNSDADAYFARVRAQLGRLQLGTFWNHLVVRVLVLPALAPEYALSIEKKAQRYYAVLARCPRRLTGPAPHPAEPPIVLSAPISPALAEAASNAIDAALARTRYPRSGAGELVLDGTQYHFLCGGRAGSAHSPRPGTPLGALVELVELLRHTAAQEPELPPEAALVAWARELSARLQGSDS